MHRRAGIILCGGASSRFGTRKEWLTIDGETLLARNVASLARVVTDVVVVAHPSEEVPSLPAVEARVTLIRDAEPNQGPLEAILSGWSAIDSRIERTFVTACDVPVLLPGFIERMFELAGDWTLTIPSVRDHLYPLSAVYHRDALPAASDLARDRRAGPSRLARLVPTRIVTRDELSDVDHELQSLVSINTEDEWRAWQASIHRQVEPRKSEP